MSVPRLHLVTDDAVLGTDGFVSRARLVLEVHGSAVAVHLRGHGTPARELWELARVLAPVAEASGARLLVNDRIDVALAVSAAGAQLGRRSLPVAAARRLLGEEAILGYSAHAVDEARRAVAEGADVVVAGTIYASASHPGEPPAGEEWLAEVVRAVDAPVIAIGGITPARAAEARAVGAHGVAVLSGVWASDDAAHAAYRYLERMEAAV